jgi:hypothetical protein
VRELGDAAQAALPSVVSELGLREPCSSEKVESLTNGHFSLCSEFPSAHRKSTTQTTVLDSGAMLKKVENQFLQFNVVKVAWQANNWVGSRAVCSSRGVSLIGSRSGGCEHQLLVHISENPKIAKDKQPRVTNRTAGGHQLDDGGVGRAASLTDGLESVPKVESQHRKPPPKAAAPVS